MDSESFRKRCEMVIRINKSYDNSVYRRLLQKINEYGFEGFIHMTNLSNFKKILKSGFLFPRTFLEENDSSFDDCAEPRVLNKTHDYVKECVRFYYQTHTPAYYVANYKDPVCLVFDGKLLRNPNAIVLNMSAGYERYCIPLTMADAINNDWETIFSQGPISKERSNYVKSRRDTDFLIHDKVPISFISKIYCQYMDVCGKVEQLLRKYEIKGIEVILNPDAFQKKRK